MIPFGNSGAAQLMMTYVEAVSKAVMFVGALGAVHYKETDNSYACISFGKLKHKENFPNF